jgi:hypothetical protein
LAWAVLGRPFGAHSDRAGRRDFREDSALHPLGKGVARDGAFPCRRVTVEGVPT